MEKLRNILTKQKSTSSLKNTLRGVQAQSFKNTGSQPKQTIFNTPNQTQQKQKAKEISTPPYFESRQNTLKLKLKQLTSTQKSYNSLSIISQPSLSRFSDLSNQNAQTPTHFDEEPRNLGENNIKNSTNAQNNEKQGQMKTYQLFNSNNNQFDNTTNPVDQSIGRPKVIKHSHTQSTLTPKSQISAMNINLTFKKPVANPENEKVLSNIAQKIQNKKQILQLEHSPGGEILTDRHLPYNVNELYYSTQQHLQQQLR